MARPNLAHLNIFTETKTEKMGYTLPVRRAYVKASASIARQTLKRRESQRKWYEANPEYHLKYYEANAEKRGEHTRKWREANPEKVREIGREYYKANPERTRNNLRKWRKANPERSRAQVHRRRARKLAAEGSHTAEDIQLQYKSQEGRCWWCQCELLGKYDVDHIVPLTKGGSDAAENLVCACQSCNRSKGAKLPHEFIKRLL